MGRHAAHKILRPIPTRSNILCPKFQHIFEVCADVCEFPLEKEDYVLCVLGLLGGGGGGSARAGERLQIGDGGV